MMKRLATTKGILSILILGIGLVAAYFFSKPTSSPSQNDQANQRSVVEAPVQNIEETPKETLTPESVEAPAPVVTTPALKRGRRRTDQVVKSENDKENIVDKSEQVEEVATKQAEDVQDTELKPVDGKYLLNSKGSLYLGTGLDYLSFQQAGATGNDSGSFAKPVMPTFLLGLQYQLAENSRVLFEYQSWSGDLDASDVGPINGTRYSWTSLFAEYQQRVYQTPHSAYSLLLGVQQHEIPFLSGNALSQIDILHNKLLTGSLGVQGKFLSESRKYETELEFRYQPLLSSESLDGYQFKASSPSMFEGSIGISRYFDKGFKAGVYWLGQQQNFSYEFSRDGVDSAGKQTLFNSNIQIRFGWEFLSLLTVSSVPLSLRLRRRLKKGSKMKKHKSVIFILMFWSGAIFIGAFCWQLGVFKQFQVDEQRHRAIALRDMNDEWLKEAQMNQRISVKTVDLKKDQNDRLTFVKVTLDSVENYQLEYKEKLLVYLQRRALSETGTSVQFAFRE